MTSAAQTSTAADHKSVRVRIEGLVQGVWFRAWTVDAATSLGLDGWVRNRRDGTVEAVFAGAVPVVDRMIELCHEGPTRAVVGRVIVEAETEAVPAGFRKMPTL